MSLAETDPKLLVLPSTTIELRRNDGAQVEFRAKRIDDVVAQLTKLSVETRLNESATAENGYPIGSNGAHVHARLRSVATVRHSPYCMAL